LTTKYASKWKQIKPIIIIKKPNGIYRLLQSSWEWTKSTETEIKGIPQMARKYHPDLNRTTRNQKKIQGNQ
jgi:hypothetical protein